MTSSQLLCPLLKCTGGHTICHKAVVVPFCQSSKALVSRHWPYPPSPLPTSSGKESNGLLLLIGWINTAGCWCPDWGFQLSNIDKVLLAHASTLDFLPTLSTVHETSVQKCAEKKERTVKLKGFAVICIIAVLWYFHLCPLQLHKNILEVQQFYL